MSGKLVINVKAIRRNILKIKKQTKGSLFCAVVKAQCYGIGIGLCRYIKDSVDYWAVACISEAQQVAEISDKPILVLSPPDKEEYEQVPILPRNIEYAVDSLDVLKFIIDKKINCKIHIAVNTGMNRYGTDYELFISMLHLLKSQDSVKLAGVFSHFCKNDSKVMKEQYNRFKPFVEVAKRFDNNVLCHISNSNGISYPLDMVRVGIGLYSNNDFDSLQLISYIKNIRDVPVGQCVGYRQSYKATENIRVAVVPLGYADGIMRKQGGGYVIIENMKCKIIGDICMDCFMVDITKCKSAQIKSRVVIWGKMHKYSINICKVATKCDTISYELLSRIGGRVKRVYK